MPLSNTRKSQRRSGYVGWESIPSGVLGERKPHNRTKIGEKDALDTGASFSFFAHAPYASLMFLISIAQRATGSRLKSYTKLPRQNRSARRSDRRGRGMRPTSLPNPLKTQRNSAVRSTPFLTNAILCCLMVRSHDSPFLGSGHVFPNALPFLPAKQAVFVKQVVGQSGSVR